MDSIIIWRYVITAVVFSALGILILIFGVIVFDKLTPGQLWKEIAEEKNMPLALTCSAAIIALGNIIAAAIHG
ncbi:MAG: DUF350 domain-containing protein [Chitinophagaceae bacterium]|nr:DUF350 domain-containing protein [Oligoflexus sp.]